MGRVWNYTHRLADEKEENLKGMKKNHSGFMEQCPFFA